MAAIVQCNKKYKKKINTKLKAFSDQFFWSGFIRSLLLSYFQICLLAESKAEMYLTYQDNEAVRDQTDFISGLTIYFVALLIPFCLSIFLYVNFENIDSDEMKKKYEILSQGMFLRKEASFWDLSGVWHYPIVFFRRWVFCLIPVLFLSRPCFQFIGIAISNLGFSAAYFFVRPQLDPIRRLIEQFNECVFSILIYHLILFTEYRSSLLLSYYAGWSFVGFIGILVLGNIVSLIISIIRSCIT